MSNLVHKEATDNFTGLGATVAELQALYHGAGAAPAPIQAQPAAVDPVAYGLILSRIPRQRRQGPSAGAGFLCGAGLLCGNFGWPTAIGPDQHAAAYA